MTTLEEALREVPFHEMEEVQILLQPTESKRVTNSLDTQTDGVVGFNS